MPAPLPSNILRLCAAAFLCLAVHALSVVAERAEPPTDIGIISIHGLNQSPGHFRQVEQLLPDIPSPFVSRVELAGHRSPQDCEQTIDDPLAVWRTQVEIALAENPAQKLVIVGYSLGALLALDASAHDDRIRGLVLFAPPLELRWKVAAIHLLTPLAVFGWSLPSIAPEHSRACSSTPLQWYAASLELQSSPLTSFVPVLIFAEPNDELASFAGIQRWIAENSSLERGQIRLAPVETTGRYAAHLIVDKDNLSEESWTDMGRILRRFLRAVSARQPTP